jgi:HD-GYP domain-containing protein (c-di-GMP phosphodiesterase class II)
VDILEIIKRYVKIYNWVAVLIIATVLLVNARFLTQALNYIPLLSVVIMLFIILGLVVIGFVILKNIAGTVLKKVTEYNNEINSLLLSKEEELTERKKAEDDLKKMRDELENMVKERTAELSTTVQALKEQVAHSQKTEELLRRSKDEWEETFNAIPDMITVHDNNLNIVNANYAAKEILNLLDSEITKTIRCFQYYKSADNPPENCPSRRSLKTGKPVALELFDPNLKKFVEIRAVPQYDKQNQLASLIHLVRDITEQKLAEKKIQKQFEHLNALHSIEKAVKSSLDLKVTLDILLDQVTKQLAIDAAAVLLFNKHTQMLEYVSSSGFYSDALRYTRLRLGEGNAGRAAKEHRIVAIPDLRENITGFARSKSFAGEDFIAYYAIPLIAKGQIEGVLELFHRRPFHADSEWLDFSETIADQAAIAIENASLFKELQNSNVELMLAYDTTIEGWSRALDLRDKETEGHSQRVTEMTFTIGQNMGIKDEALVHIRRGALLHDIGKMGIPDNILLKPEKLNDEEWKIMKLHPVYAKELLSPIEYLRPAIDIPYCHHEKWDGSGYPRGLKGEEIPLSARIFAIVDVYDAMSHDRPYCLASPKEKVIDHIRSLKSSHFDPEVAEIFLKMEL